MVRDPNSSRDLEVERLEAVRADMQAQIAQLSGLDDASFNLKSALEALLNAPAASAGQLQAAAAPLVAQAATLRTGGAKSDQSHIIAYVLSEEALAEERQKLLNIEASLFDAQFQADLRDTFARGGDDLVEAYDAATEAALAELERINVALEQDTLTREEVQALLEQKHAVLYGYSGDMDALLDRAAERGVDVDRLKERIQEHLAELEASPLASEQRAAKIEQAGREAAAVAANVSADNQTIVMDDAMHDEVNLLVEVVEKSPEIEQREAETQATLQFDETGLDDLFSLNPTDTGVASKNTKIELG